MNPIRLRLMRRGRAALALAAVACTLPLPAHAQYDRGGYGQPRFQQQDQRDGGRWQHGRGGWRHRDRPYAPAWQGRPQDRYPQGGAGGGLVFGAILGSVLGALVSHAVQAPPPVVYAAPAPQPPPGVYYAPPPSPGYYAPAYPPGN